jgi:hypothetical protein
MAVYTPHGEVRGISRCPFQTIFLRSRTSYEGYASPPADTLARVDEFLTCSDWSRGVARVKCTACDYSYFRPFSCKSFHLSPGTPLRGLPAATRSAQSFTRSIWPRNCFWNFPIASSSSRYPATSLRSFRPENPYGILHSLVSRRGLQADFRVAVGVLQLGGWAPTSVRVRRLLPNRGNVTSFLMPESLPDFHPHWHVQVWATPRAAYAWWFRRVGSIRLSALGLRRWFVEALARIHSGPVWAEPKGSAKHKAHRAGPGGD